MTAEVQPSESISASAEPPNLADLCLHFMLISAAAFGGVLPWARRKLVEDRRWLTESESFSTH